MKALRATVVVLLIGSVRNVPAQVARARVWSGTVPLSAAEESPPDPLPQLRLLTPDAALYPYTAPNPPSAIVRTQVWRALFLENEHVSCTFLPDLGGRVHLCRNKSTGAEVLSPPPTPTQRPVDFAIAQRADSASIWLGETDRATGTRWRIEYRLEAGSANLQRNLRTEKRSAALQSGDESQWELVKAAAGARTSGDDRAAGATIQRALAIDPSDPLARFEHTRQSAADPGLWTHLAAGPERILDIADAYMEWGLYRDAAIVLGLRYVPTPASWREPGMPTPPDYPLIAYYRGYVHQKLNQYATEDFRLASSLPATYVFPIRATSREVLRAALSENPGDASAQYLLALWELHAGNREEGVRHVQEANRLRPDLAEARAVLKQLHLEAREPAPSTVPARTPIAAPRSNPPPVAAPVAEPKPAPDLDRAFNLADTGNCRDALRAIAALDVAAGAREHYFAAVIEDRCGNSKPAARRWEQVAKMKPPVESRDYAYPQLALAALGRPFDAVSPYLNVRRALDTAGASGRVVLLYTEAILLTLQGRRDLQPTAYLFEDFARLRLPR